MKRIRIPSRCLSECCEMCLGRARTRFVASTICMGRQWYHCPVVVSAERSPFVASKLYCTLRRYFVARFAAMLTCEFSRIISCAAPHRQRLFAGNKSVGGARTDMQWLSSRIVSVHLDFGLNERGLIKRDSDERARRVWMDRYARCF
jgi:hypothetical protein